MIMYEFSCIETDKCKISVKPIEVEERNTMYICVDLSNNKAKITKSEVGVLRKRYAKYIYYSLEFNVIPFIEALIEENKSIIDDFKRKAGMLCYQNKLLENKKQEELMKCP